MLPDGSVILPLFPGAPSILPVSGERNTTHCSLLNQAYSLPSLVSQAWSCCCSQFAKSLVSQAHLCPLPLHVCPVYWAYDCGLRLYPLPDLVVCADKFDPFTRKSADCNIMNPVSTVCFASRVLLWSSLMCLCFYFFLFLYSVFSVCFVAVADLL